ncbi:unnamed protein product [marine sediment metagenome]|uniref:Uncharacterized protein n=1 Tax=marine sediment metagenome TaxID=412755 RepID=X1JDB1_9ZZZZ
MAVCDVCGVDMADDNQPFSGTSLFGLEIILKLPKKSGKVHHEICRVLETFGKTEFKICFVCWLKSLGVKEKGVN